MFDQFFGPALAELLTITFHQERILLVTTSTPPTGGIRLPSYVIILVVLLMALGALLLLATNAAPESAVRARFTGTPTITLTPSITPTPINPFASLRYIAWTSEDGLIKAEIPELWLPQSIQDSPVAYSFAIPGESIVRIEFLALPISQLGIQGAPENATPDQLLKAALATQPDITVREVSTKTLKGAGVKQTLPQTNPNTGETVSFDRDIWLLSLDAQNVMLVQGISRTDNWVEMQKVWDHFLGSLEVNTEGTLTKLNATFNPAPAATQAATEGAAPAATAAATEAAAPAETPISPSAVITPVPTGAPAPTAEATAEPTAAATQAP